MKRKSKSSISPGDGSGSPGTRIPPPDSGSPAKKPATMTDTAPAGNTDRSLAELFAASNTKISTMSTKDVAQLIIEASDGADVDSWPVIVNKIGWKRFVQVLITIRAILQDLSGFDESVKNYDDTYGGGSGFFAYVLAVKAAKQPPVSIGTLVKPVSDPDPAERAGTTVADLVAASKTKISAMSAEDLAQLIIDGSDSAKVESWVVVENKIGWMNLIPALLLIRERLENPSEMDELVGEYADKRSDNLYYTTYAKAVEDLGGDGGDLTKRDVASGFAPSPPITTQSAARPTLAALIAGSEKDVSAMTPIEIAHLLDDADDGGDIESWNLIVPKVGWSKFVAAVLQLRAGLDDPILLDTDVKDYAVQNGDGTYFTRYVAAVEEAGQQPVPVAQLPRNVRVDNDESEESDSGPNADPNAGPNVALDNDIPFDDIPNDDVRFNDDAILNDDEGFNDDGDTAFTPPTITTPLTITMAPTIITPPPTITTAPPSDDPAEKVVQLLKAIMARNSAEDTPDQVYVKLLDTALDAVGKVTLAALPVEQQMALAIVVAGHVPAELQEDQEVVDLAAAARLYLGTLPSHPKFKLSSTTAVADLRKWLDSALATLTAQGFDNLRSLPKNIDTALNTATSNAMPQYKKNAAWAQVQGYIYQLNQTLKALQEFRLYNVEVQLTSTDKSTIKEKRNIDTAELVFPANAAQPVLRLREYKAYASTDSADGTIMAEFKAQLSDYVAMAVQNDLPDLNYVFSGSVPGWALNELRAAAKKLQDSGKRLLLTDKSGTSVVSPDDVAAMLKKMPVKKISTDDPIGNQGNTYQFSRTNTAPAGSLKKKQTDDSQKPPVKKKQKRQSAKVYVPSNNTKITSFFPTVPKE
jgi:hypothetical protein